MYKLIIVDDEDITRINMVNSVLWNKLGFEVSASAENGLDAVEKIKTHVPDVVLTDVRMPEMDGIQLIQYLNENYPEIKVIILSAYSDLVYFQHAIKSKVSDYLIKPTCIDEFIKVFEKMKAVLDEEKLKKDEYDSLKKQLLESMPFMREKFLNQLVLGYFNDIKAIRDKLDFYKIDLPYVKIAVVTMEIDNFQALTEDYAEEKRQLLKMSVVYSANQAFGETDTGICFPGSSDEIIGICSMEAGYNMIISRIQDIQKSFFESRQLTLSAGVSFESESLAEAPVLFEQSKIALKQKVFLGKESIVLYRDIHDIETASYIKYSIDTDKAINTIFYSEDVNIRKYLDELFQGFENKPRLHYQYINKICLELLINVSKHAGQYNISLEDLLAQKKRDLFDINKLDTIEAKKEFLLDVLTEISMKISSFREKNTCRIIEVAKGYINENYCKNGISLEAVAEKVNKNPGYLSKLLKLPLIMGKPTKCRD